jgi:hypothetical protein
LTLNGDQDDVNSDKPGGAASIQNQMSGQYCFINPNRYNDNKTEIPPYPNSPGSLGCPSNFNPYTLASIYHPVLSENSHILRHISSPVEEEINYQKLQSWNVNQVQLFVTKFLVFG